MHGFLDSPLFSIGNLFMSRVTHHGNGPTHVKSAVQCIAVALENYFPIPCKVSYPYAYFVWECMHMGTRLCKEWENNFPTQLQYTVIKLFTFHSVYFRTPTAVPVYLCNLCIIIFWLEFCQPRCGPLSVSMHY